MILGNINTKLLHKMKQLLNGVSYFTNEPNTSQYRLNMTYMVQKHIKKCIL